MSKLTRTQKNVMTTVFNVLNTFIVVYIYIYIYIYISGGTTCVWAPVRETNSGPHNSLPEII